MEHAPVDRPQSRSGAGEPGGGAGGAQIGGSRRLVAELESWAAGAVVAEEVARRRRERWLARQAEEEATIAGVLADLAEGERSVVLSLRGGRSWSARVAVVGSDFLLASAPDADLLARFSALASLRPEPGPHPPRGDRHLGLRLTFEEAVRAACADRPRVVAHCGVAEPVRGVVRISGRDVLAVETSAVEARTVFVPLPALDALVLCDRA